MDAILQTLARELERSPEHVQNVVTLIDEGATIPLSPATARSSTAPWTTSCCAGWRTAFSTCGTWRPGRGRSPPLSRTRASSPRSSPTPSLRPPLWRRWRTCTAPISQKRRTRATIAREKGLEPLARLLSAQGPAVDPVRRPWTFWTRTRGWRRRRTPSRGPVTSWPRDLRRRRHPLGAAAAVSAPGHAGLPGCGQGAGGHGLPPVLRLQGPGGPGPGPPGAGRQPR